MKNKKSVISVIVISMILSLGVISSVYAACTSINSVPYTISSAGNYCLNKNFADSFTQHAITIAASNVVLNLNGHSILNTTGAPGVYINGISAGNYNNITITNGTVSNFDYGIKLDGVGNLIEQMTIDRFYNSAIEVNGGIVRNCVVKGDGVNSNWGINMSQPGSRVINNDIYDVYREGISAFGDGIVVDGNRIGATAPDANAVGIYYTHSTDGIVTNNVVTNMPTGIVFSGTGKYRNNLTSGCATPYAVGAGVIDAGNNN